jgi:hypothetical protein
MWFQEFEVPSCTEPGDGHTNLLRACSVVPDWSPGLILSRITSLIYIDFDELE